MPIYEFHCPRCQKPFEQLVFNRSEVPPCPTCGNVAVERMMSACNSNIAGGSTHASSSASSGGGCGGCTRGSCSGCSH